MSVCRCCNPHTQCSNVYLCVPFWFLPSVYWMKPVELFQFHFLPHSVSTSSSQVTLWPFRVLGTDLSGQDQPTAFLSGVPPATHSSMACCPMACSPVAWIGIYSLFCFPSQVVRMVICSVSSGCIFLSVEFLQKLNWSVSLDVSSEFKSLLAVHRLGWLAGR